MVTMIWNTKILVYINITEILNSESLKDLFYIILVIGNMINAVSHKRVLYSVVMVDIYREVDQVVHMDSLLIHWIT